MPDQSLHERLRERREVRIRTESAGGEQHRTIVWIVVDERERILVRSWRGAGARWYREATSGRAVALVLDGKEHPVTIDAADPDRIEACSRALEAKYAGSSSTPSMLRDEILDTTLELHPVS